MYVDHPNPNYPLLVNSCYPNSLNPCLLENRLLSWNGTNRVYASNPDSSSSATSNSPNKPSADQLLHVHNTLANSLPNLFIQPMDYSVYNPDLIFENNIRGIRTM